MPFAAVVEEQKRRDAPVNGLFPPQKAAATSASRFKAIRTPRRAGKSTTILSRFLQLGMKYPRSRMPYIMLTRGQAKDVAWPVLKELDERYDVNCKFNETELYATFPNKSIISLYGADKAGWMPRMRGQKNRAAAVDESQDFSIQLEDLVYQVLRPTVLDLQGEIYLAGTPGLFRAGLFYHVTMQTGKYPGWETFNWSTADNPAVSKEYLSEIDQIKADHHGIDIMTLPWVRREYFGEWVEDEQNSVYFFDPARNGAFTAFNKKDHPEAKYVGGIDLGFDDGMAMVVGAYLPHDESFTVLESIRLVKTPLDEMVRMVKSYEEEYPGIRFVCDPARKQLMVELQQRADVYIEVAEKQEKRDWIDVVNRDLLSGKFKIVFPEQSQLAEEMRRLKWLMRPSGKREEHPGMPNDCCDAALYAYRRSWHFRATPETKRPTPGSKEFYTEEARRLKQAAIDRTRQGDRDRRKRNWR